MRCCTRTTGSSWACSQKELVMGKWLLIGGFFVVLFVVVKRFVK